jgi:hypothetical protein
VDLVEFIQQIQISEFKYSRRIRLAMKNGIETSDRIRNKIGNDGRICVGPTVDIEQSLRLIDKNISANILLNGHGGGENCTSLAGGGAADALELVYLMSINPEFNKTAIGLEGGTGTSFGALLGMVDVVSNRRGIAAGIEAGSLYMNIQMDILFEIVLNCVYLYTMD